MDRRKTGKLTGFPPCCTKAVQSIPVESVRFDAVVGTNTELEFESGLLEICQERHLRYDPQESIRNVVANPSSGFMDPMDGDAADGNCARAARLAFCEKLV